MQRARPSQRIMKARPRAVRSMRHQYRPAPAPGKLRDAMNGALANVESFATKP